MFICSQPEAFLWAPKLWVTEVDGALSLLVAWHGLGALTRPSPGSGVAWGLWGFGDRAGSPWILFFSKQLGRQQIVDNCSQFMDGETL